MQIGLVTLFPEMFSAVSEHGITGRACRKGLISLNFWNPRDFAEDRHRTVDDKPFGGGPGMLMKSGPLQRAIAAGKSSIAAGKGSIASQEAPAEQRQPRVIYLSPQGRRIDHEAITELAAEDAFLLVCGRYQGIDARVIASEIDEEWSLGDFVLSGGELAAMAVIDAVTRQQFDALGDSESAKQDSFAKGLLHWPEYTRPQQVGELAVPKVLLSGDHAAIARWRLQQSLGSTWLKRPDLLEGRELSSEERSLLDEYIASVKGQSKP